MGRKIRIDEPYYFKEKPVSYTVLSLRFSCRFLKKPYLPATYLMRGPKDQAEVWDTITV